MVTPKEVVFRHFGLKTTPFGVTTNPFGVTTTSYHCHTRLYCIVQNSDTEQFSQQFAKSINSYSSHLIIHNEKVLKYIHDI